MKRGLPISYRKIAKTREGEKKIPIPKGVSPKPQS
jgi:hypothetical protein